MWVSYAVTTEDVLKLARNVLNFDNVAISAVGQVSDKEYSIDEIQNKDNVDVPFILDERAVGFWSAYSYIRYEQKETIKTIKKSDDIYLKSLSLSPNGEAVIETQNGIFKVLWTKNSIIDKRDDTNSNYIIRTINGEDYLIMDWKSGDYIFGGKIFGCYVFKKIK